MIYILNLRFRPHFGVFRPQIYVSEYSCAQSCGVKNNCDRKDSHNKTQNIDF